MAERSSVSNGPAETVWATETVTIALADEAVGGWYGSVERQSRGGLNDTVFGTSAYRRLGDWTIGGGASASPSSTFWFRREADAELSRRIVGTIVLSTAYRFMDFPTAAIHQVQPAVTWYNPRGEVQARVYLTRNATHDRTSPAVLARSVVRLNKGVAVTGIFAAGDRIFDIASLAFGTARSWTARGGVRLNVSARNAVEIGAGFAHEEPGFSQRTIALSYRRSF